MRVCGLPAAARRDFCRAEIKGDARVQCHHSADGRAAPCFFFVCVTWGAEALREREGEEKKEKKKRRSIWGLSVQAREVARWDLEAQGHVDGPWLWCQP